MAEETGIEWCDSTHNFWIGCTKVSPGCDNCYAEVSTPSRTQQVVWGPGKPRHRTGPANWGKPVAWERSHLSFELAHGRRRRVFAQSLSDTFDNEAPEAWRADAFALIRATPHLDWLMLTKRIGNVAKMLPPEGLPPNVWLGITVVNQAEADRDIPKLLEVPARVRFLSMEPLLGPVDLGLCDCDRGSRPGPGGVGGVACPRCNGTGGRMLDWVIVGGESGKDARPMHPDWVRSLRDQCASAGVPFLFKQWGEHSLHMVGDDGELEPSMPMNLRGLKVCTPGSMFVEAKPTDMAGDVFVPGAALALPVGKKAAGRLLDGVTHDGYPEAPHA